MEESQDNQDRSKFGAFVDKVSGDALGTAGEVEQSNRRVAPQAGRVSLNGRRSMPSDFAMYDASVIGSNGRFVGFSQSDCLPDNQSLASAFEGMTLGFKNQTAGLPNIHRNASLINGHFPLECGNSASGLTPSDVAMNPQRVPAIVQDEFRPLHFSAAHAKQKVDEQTVEHQEQDYSFPPYSGNFSRSSGMRSTDSISGAPYHPSTASASPFQQQFYADEPSQIYAPYDQHVGSFMWQHDMGVQPYPVMQSHYVYPQMQQVSGLDVPRMRRNQQAAVCNTSNGTSSYIGTPRFHGLESGDPYLNGAALQRRNNQLNSTFVDRFPSTLYTDSSRGNNDFRQFQQAEKFGFLQHQVSDKLNAASYPENTLMRSSRVNSVRNIKFGPTINGCNAMDQRVNGYGHNHLNIQSNNSMHFDWLSPQFWSSKSVSESAMGSPQLNYDSVDEVVGRICAVAKDQNGCRFLQKVFAEGTREDAEKIFAEIIENIGELMVDPFAHYLVQKILEGCSNDQRMRIIYEITKKPGELVKVSCNMHGTRVVQKVIETTNSMDEALNVVSALSPGAARLMTDANGSHVVQRCLQKMLPEHKEFLLDAAASCHLQLARDRHGCCVLQKCIEHSNDEQKHNLLSKITSNALRLSEDQYGNYVIQFILNLKTEWATAKVVDELEGHFGNLSMQKCGSHVVEYCLKLAPQPMRDMIISELMNDPKLPHIMVDQYGNYVIQTALKQCKGALHSAFIEAIRPHAALLRTNMYGKRVISRTYLKNRQY
ncbi:hypothetical protein ACP70R_007503 [Stipagrostis hirtigluma subsp. patula]